MVLNKNRLALRDSQAPTRHARSQPAAWVSGLPADIQIPISANLIEKRDAELAIKGLSGEGQTRALGSILDERFKLLCRHFKVDGCADGYRALAFLLALEFLPGFRVKPRRGRPSKPGAAKATRSLFNQALRAADTRKKRGRQKDPKVEEFDRALLRAIDSGKLRLQAKGVKRPSDRQALELILERGRKGRAGEYANLAREARRREKTRRAATKNLLWSIRTNSS